MQDINSLIKILNDYCKENNIYYLDDVRKKLCEFDINFITINDTIEFTTHTEYEHIYEVIISDRKYYIGTWETPIESRLYGNFIPNNKLKFYEVEPFVKICYKTKE